MVRKFRVVDGKIIEQSDKEASIMLYINPDVSECKYLVEKHSIDEHTLQSALDPNELARLELEPDHCALIIKRPRRYCANDNFFFRVESIGMFIFHDIMIILISEELPLFEGRQFTTIIALQDIMLKIFHRSVIHFEEHLKVINACSEDLEQGINTSVSNKQLLSMFTLEKSLVFYLDAISSNGHVIDKIRSNAVKLRLTAPQLEFLDDLAIENRQCLGMAQNYSQVLSGLMDARASLISNNLNVMMKNLNALVIAIAVPTFFTGVGGMSEFSGFLHTHNIKLGYPFFVLAMMCVACTTFLIIKLTEKYWNK
jgi:magnesium transporter